MSTPRRDNRRFQRRPGASGVYTCGRCGKRTRETGGGESDLALCALCHEISGMENWHSDQGHAGEMSDCQECMTGMSQAAQDKVKAEQAATDPLQHDYSGLDFNKP